jgi:hypothetical protein
MSFCYRFLLSSPVPSVRRDGDHTLGSMHEGTKSPCFEKPLPTLNHLPIHQAFPIQLHSYAIPPSLLIHNLGKSSVAYTCTPTTYLFHLRLTPFVTIIPRPRPLIHRLRTNHINIRRTLPLMRDMFPPTRRRDVFYILRRRKLDLSAQHTVMG